ncbi:hypothetical protein QE422_003662 [Chryseobacterium sp. SORGH_AS 447]|nr:hypothetical protein [Chryseobacterium sp. SORGH_AS_0447]
MEIIWSEETFENYIKVIDYLLENWTMKEVERFENNSLIYKEITSKIFLITIIHNRSYHIY